MNNYVIFLDTQEKPLNYQAVQKALASIGVKTDGFKQLTQRDDAYFDGTLCVDCMGDDEDDEEDEEEEADEDDDKKTLSPLQRKMKEIRARHHTDWVPSDDEYGFEYNGVAGYTNNAHTIFLAPDLLVGKLVSTQTRFYYEAEKYHKHYFYLGRWCYDANYVSQALSKVGAIANGHPPKMFFIGKEGILGISFYRNTAQIIIAPRIVSEDEKVDHTKHIRAGEYQVKK